MKISVIHFKEIFLRHFRLRRILTLCAFVSSPALAIDQVVVIGSQSATSYSVSNQLLTLILDSTKAEFGPYEITYSNQSIKQRPRIMLELLRGTLFNLTEEITQPDWESQAIPVRIPTDKGLSSYRIFAINPGDQARFSSIHDVSELKKLRLGTGKTWSTTKIYLEDGFQVEPGLEPAPLYAMMSLGRFDFFPRSIYEIYPEIERRKNEGLSFDVEKSLALYVPVPRYFFISPKFPRLAQRIAAGFEIIIKNGDYDRYVMARYGDAIKQTDLCSRRLFVIPNSELTKETPLARKELWFSCTQTNSKINKQHGTH